MDEGIRQDLIAPTSAADGPAPLVSVIMPLYNMEEFVSDTLHSVLASTYHQIEVIVVDDGSTDASPRIVAEIAARDARVKLLHQENAGPSRARNRAVAASNGVYILPVDADNLLAPQFIAQAVPILEAHPEVKVVRPTMEFIGDKQGHWQLPEFSLPLLARRNHIDTCALYRRADFDRVGGYCETIIAREDWDFWIAVLKDGGEVVRLPEVGYYYRVRKQSKRIRDRRLKAHVTAVLNERHALFFEQQLGGPLRKMRSWSRWINTLTRPLRYRKAVTAEVTPQVKQFVEQLPWRFATEGCEIFKNRNAIRRFEVGGDTLVVKQFCLPHAFNRFVYRWFRSSKAQRSFEYARSLRAHGIGSPEPVGYCETGTCFALGYCYYVSRCSTLPYDFRHLIGVESETEEKALRAIAETTARLHEAGYWHKDYSGGNILWGETPEGIAVELIDLNRMRLGTVTLERGCANFDRLEATERQQRIMAEAYAAVRGFDVEAVFQEIVKARSKQLAHS